MLRLIYYTSRNLFQGANCTKMLYIMVSNWEKPKCQSTVNQVNKVYYIHTVKYDTDIKNDEIKKDILKNGEIYLYLLTWSSGQQTVACEPHVALWHLEFLAKASLGIP